MFTAAIFKVAQTGYLFDEILLSNKKEEITDTRDMDGFKHYAK